jgi:7-cyano-7-deazaguanine synthase
MCEDLGINLTKFILVQTLLINLFGFLNIDGTWYSDYKSASSVERVEAFISLGRKDPVRYADESGEVDWETVKKHVSAVLAAGTGAHS